LKVCLIRKRLEMAKFLIKEGQTRLIPVDLVSNKKRIDVVLAKRECDKLIQNLKCKS